MSQNRDVVTQSDVVIDRSLTTCLLSYGQFGVQRSCGVFAGPDVEGGGLDYPFLRLGAPELQLVFAEEEIHSLRFAGLEGDATEALELADRTGGGAGALVDVHLCHRVAGDGAGIGHVHGNFRGAIALDAGAADAEVGEGEGGVAQPISEGIERLGGEV